MKNDKEIEQILLNDKNYDKFIKAKTEKEYNQILNSNSDIQKVEVTDFKKVPNELLFGKDTVYSLISKSSRTISYINGIQAESYLVDEVTRKQFLSKETDSFVYGDYYIKFKNAKV